MATVGIDEVGRGCWAGPVTAGAVVLGAPIDGLKDSKQLSARVRERLSATIRVRALAVAIGWSSPAEIDALGLTAAVSLAMRRALEAIDVMYDEVVIDGAYNFLPGQANVHTLVKADQTIPAVSAASIIAKVARDAYMRRLAATYPAYGFERHVGYGTRQHQSMLVTHGVCPEHRKSFRPVRALLE